MLGQPWFVSLINGYTSYHWAKSNTSHLPFHCLNHAWLEFIFDSHMNWLNCFEHTLIIGKLFTFKSNYHMKICPNLSLSNCHIMHLIRGCLFIWDLLRLELTFIQTVHIGLLNVYSPLASEIVLLNCKLEVTFEECHNLF